MDLSVLCQAPVSQGSTPAQAIANTVELALTAEKLGYKRFWVAEHHSDPALACASPEILLAHLAARTERIRIGSGGVLLPYYRPLKVAEQFRMLATLHPDRIDLGLGRSGGSEGQAPKALGFSQRDHWQAVDELLSWLRGDEVLPGTFASPAGDSLPTPWVLGTSPASATYAGRKGLPYAFGGFLDPRGLEPALMAYHQHFTPSRWLRKPHVNLAWYVQAAPTEKEAWAQARSSEHWFVEALLRGNSQPFPDPDQLSPRYTPMEQMAIAMRRQFALVGTGEQVMEGLHALQQRTQADELTLVTIPFDHADRLASYAAIAEAA